MKEIETIEMIIIPERTVLVYIGRMRTFMGRLSYYHIEIFN